MLYYDDNEILEGLKKRDEEVIRYLYKEYYPAIHLLVTTNSGLDSDAENVFQDAIIVLYRKIIQDDIKLEFSLKTFFYSICRNIWLQRLNKKVIDAEFIDIEDLTDLNIGMFEDFSEHENDEREKYRLFEQHFLSLDPDCQKVLRLFIGKTSLREIAEIMGYKNIKYAKTKKFICKEKLKALISNDPNFRKYFEDYT